MKSIFKNFNYRTVKTNIILQINYISIINKGKKEGRKERDTYCAQMKYPEKANAQRQKVDQKWSKNRL